MSRPASTSVSTRQLRAFVLHVPMQVTILSCSLRGASSSSRSHVRRTWKPPSSCCEAASHDRVHWICAICSPRVLCTSRSPSRSRGKDVDETGTRSRCLRGGLDRDPIGPRPLRGTLRIGVRIGKRWVEIPSETDAVVRGGASGGVAGFVGTSPIRRSKGEDRTGKRTHGKGNVERDIGAGTRVGRRHVYDRGKSTCRIHETYT